MLMIVGYHWCLILAGAALICLLARIGVNTQSSSILIQFHWSGVLQKLIAMLSPIALVYELLAVNAVRMPVKDFCPFLILRLDVKRRFGFTVEIFPMRCTSLNVFKKEPIPFNTNGFGESPLKAAMVIGTVFAPVNINAFAMAGNLNKREL